MSDSIIKTLIDAGSQARATQKVLDNLGVGKSDKKSLPKDIVYQKSAFSPNPIFEGLMIISEPLAKSYAQAKIDLEDESRISWAGTAHEIRQVVSTMLHLLAPDKDVIAQQNYQQDPKTSGPTQKQRAIYILRKNKAGSNAQEVVQQIAHFDDMVSDLVRAIYSRASDAAHRIKDRREAIRLMTYFEAFAPDLLNLP